ncbi:MAG: putative thiazole biosynthetic enzyme [Anaerolineae bacterium]|nr:putative thiazole biosynthetic enzyme [Anaerolineae bacterium]
MAPNASESRLDKVRVEQFDVVIAGGGPGGLSAAKILAERGARVLILEANAEIGSPTRTTGGTFIRDAQELEIPPHLYHVLRRGRMHSAHRVVTREYPTPFACILNVRGVFQFLAERAIAAGAKLRVGATARDTLMENGTVVGVSAQDTRGQSYTTRAQLTIDGTGYRATLCKRAGVHGGFKRFGVGAEYDMYAPHYDESETVGIVGSAFAPAGYAWTAPYGKRRVRVGVGIIHGDSTENPADYLDKFVSQAEKFNINLKGAQPLEYHHGLIPSDGMAPQFVGNGIMAVGDAAGQPSALLGEGIRWAMRGGILAGNVAADALQANDVSKKFLARYEQQWRKTYGKNLRIAAIINKRIAGWSDAQWDEGIELLNQLNAEQFGHALASNFVSSWTLWALAGNPKLLRKSLGLAREMLFARAN